MSPDGVVVGQGFHARGRGARRSARSRWRVRARGSHRCSARSSRAATVDGPGHAWRAWSRPASRAWWRRATIRIRWWTGAASRTLRAHGVEVEVGVGRAAAVALNQPFFTRMREGRPFVIVKAATSQDGRIAAAPGQRTVLTSAAADRHAHRFRAEVDAIGVGVGTIVADDPVLTARSVYRERPLARVIFDRSLRTPVDARVLSTRDAGPVIIVTTAAGAARAELRTRLEERGAIVEVAGDGSFRAALRLLGGSRNRVSSARRRRRGARGGVGRGPGRLRPLSVTPHVIGERWRGVAWTAGRSFSSGTLPGPSCRSART